MRHVSMDGRGISRPRRGLGVDYWPVGVRPLGRHDTSRCGGRERISCCGCRRRRMSASRRPAFAFAFLVGSHRGWSRDWTVVDMAGIVLLGAGRWGVGFVDVDSVFGYRQMRRKRRKRRKRFCSHTRGAVCLTRWRWVGKNGFRTDVKGRKGRRGGGLASRIPPNEARAERGWGRKEGS